MLSKMKHGTGQGKGLGSRIAEVHNGSSLFTGDAGQGESNIRRRLIENDWLEAIVALPLNMFYNTGIATYIWVLSNRKAIWARFVLLASFEEVPSRPRTCAGTRSRISGSSSCFRLRWFS
jgi:hypothetical protein